MKHLPLLLLGLFLQARTAAQNPLCFNPMFLDSLTACTTLYDPVCGCDSTTYDNACVALTQHGAIGFVPGACNQVTGPCNATAALVERFHVYAKALAFQRQAYVLNDHTQIDIPDSLYQQALKAFIGVAQLQDSPARDQLMAYWTSYFLPGHQSVFEIEVFVDTGQTWAKNLDLGLLPSGEPLVDSLMYRYQLKAGSRHYTYGNFRMINFVSSSPLNVYALRKAFLPAAGVLFTQLAQSSEGHLKVQIDFWTYPMNLLFTLGWDTHAHIWNFTINENCEATFAWESGNDPLPPVAVETPSTIQRFEVNGQPGRPDVQIRVELDAAQPFEIRVWNALGQLLSARTYREAALAETFDWQGAAPGLYLFELRTAQGRSLRKVLH